MRQVMAGRKGLSALAEKRGYKTGLSLQIRRPFVLLDYLLVDRGSC